MVGAAAAAAAALALAAVLAAPVPAAPPAPVPVSASPASISASPGCLPAARPKAVNRRNEIVVRGTQFNPFTAVLVTFDAGPGGRPESFAGRTDGFGRFALRIRPNQRTATSVVVRADDFREREATTRFLVPCHPFLALAPPIGPPGFVPLAIGRDFPPGAELALEWSPGVTEQPAVPIRADRAGRFRVRVPVFPNEAFGFRELRARPLGPDVFGSASTPFLVIQRTFSLLGLRL